MTVTEAPVDRLDALEAKIDLLIADAEHRRGQRELFESLVGDAAPLGPDVMAAVTERLTDAEQKGYFAMAGAAAGVVDRVVTNFDEHDVELLGDNVVAMLEALREVTQPEMLAFLGRMLDAVQAEQAAVELESTEPPSLWSLARQVRDPEIRRGMARALHTLRAVSAETGPNPNKGETK
jgi:uncharacterized protein YjgD (DUF1641 family)